MQHPSSNCDLCPRLKKFREDNRVSFPGKFNAPVPSFGPEDAEFLVVGLAPGLRGANFTGRPFTGDYAGDLLYATLLKFGFARGVYQEHKDDGLTLINCRITNAVRCVPPENKPTGPEMSKCRPFLEAEIARMKKLKIILSLGKISFDAVVRSCGHKMTDFKFTHGGMHELKNGVTLTGSYHCSRYNTNTGRLTEAMFHQVFEKITAAL